MSNPCFRDHSECARRQVETKSGLADKLIDLAFGDDEWRREHHRVTDGSHNQPVVKAKIAHNKPVLPSSGNRLPRRLVGHKLNCREQTYAARLAHQRMVRQLGDLRWQIGARALPYKVHQPLALDQID